MWGCRAGRRRQRHGEQGQPPPSRGGLGDSAASHSGEVDGDDSVLLCGSNISALQESALGATGVTSARQKVHSALWLELREYAAKAIHGCNTKGERS